MGGFFDIGHRIGKKCRVVISSTHPTIDKEMDAEVLNRDQFRGNGGALHIRLLLSVKVLPTNMALGPWTPACHLLSA